MQGYAVGAVLHLLWGGQSCLRPPFRRLFRDVSEPSRGKGRLKAGCSHDWLPHNLRDALQDQKVRGIRLRVCATVSEELVEGDYGRTIRSTGPAVWPARYH